MTERESLIDLEFLLIAKLRPTFLAISDPDEDDGSIEIVIACTQFNRKTIQERISIVFKLISEYLGYILEDRLILVTALNNNEMDEVLDDLFSRELF